MTICVKTVPANYPFFLANRYGKVLSLKQNELNKLSKLTHKFDFFEKNQNQRLFKLKNNIPRLENFYKNLYNSQKSIKT